ncbi:T9SS type A sorting domain-containing protein [candidate division WOR-3 bacterium]|nr:T9SS type A sorting domain-containing protein [candidate division WOR-3 bacterium]
MLRKLFYLVALGILVVFVTKANAQHPDWINYTNGQDVRALADNGSEIWIGTTGGLVKLDKATDSMTFYNRANSGLHYNYIKALAIDGNDNIWIGTKWGGLAKFDGTNWTVYNTSNSGLPDNYVSALAIDGSNIWIGTEYGGLAKFDGTNWEVYNTSNSGLPDFRVYALAIDGNNNIWIGTEWGGLGVYTGEQGIEENAKSRVQNVKLFQNYPNPFHLLTTISYALPAKTNVSLKIYDISGRLVHTLINGEKDPGNHTTQWNASDSPSGIYFVKFLAGDYIQTRKLILMR